MTSDSVRALRAVIFDLDGTLVDSRLDFSAMRRELSAPDGLGLLEFIDTLPDERARREAMEVVHRHELAGAEAATWMPGAEETVFGLWEAGVPSAIVTRNSRRAAERTMERLAMPRVLLKAREDAAPKPDPEALLAIADEWRMPPGRCAYVGDFRYDIEAARRAGMLPVLYVSDGEVPEEHASVVHARTVEVLRHFHEIMRWFDL